MKPAPDFSLLCQTFFAKRLIDQHKASPHTIAAYAQTFRLLVRFAERRLETPPSKLSAPTSKAPSCPVIRRSPGKSRASARISSRKRSIRRSSTSGFGSRMPSPSGRAVGLRALRVCFSEAPAVRRWPQASRC